MDTAHCMHRTRVMMMSDDEYMSDEELLIWVNTWLDSARFDNRLTEEEQDACWIVLSAVARLQKEESE